MRLIGRVTVWGWGIPPISPLEYPIYLFLISPWQTVGKQMKLDFVVMIRTALKLNIASMNFFYKYEEKYKNLTKTNTLSITREVYYIIHVSHDSGITESSTSLIFIVVFISGCTCICANQYNKSLFSNSFFMYFFNIPAAVVSRQQVGTLPEDRAVRGRLFNRETAAVPCSGNAPLGCVSTGVSRLAVVET